MAVSRGRSLALSLMSFLVLASFFPFLVASDPTTNAQTPQNCTELPPSAFLNDAGTVFLDFITFGAATGFGYDVRNQNGHLFGLVLETPRGSTKIADDGDWGVWVVPANALASPVSVPLAFASNVGLETDFDLDRSHRYIETEICNKCTSLINARVPIPDDFAQFDGGHVIDLSHGSGLAGFTNGKTEIHPITFIRIAEGGPSRPNPNEETFRIVVGTGGTCPDYSFARVESASAQRRDETIQLFWPPPPAAISGFSFVPALEIDEITDEGFVRASIGTGPGLLQIHPTTPITGPFPVTGNFGGTLFSPWQVTRSGNTVQLDGTIRVQTGSGLLESTEGRAFDIRTFWMPLELQLVLDSVEDLGIRRNRRAFPVRSYRIRAHAKLGGDKRVRALLENLEWRLHETNTGFSTPAPRVIGTGSTLEYIHDIAPSHGLSAYDLRLELLAPAVPLSVAAPITIPSPRVRIREIKKTEACITLPSGDGARSVTVQFEAQTTGFASGPNVEWTIHAHPRAVGAPPIATGTGLQLTHEFQISRSSPANYFEVTATATDLAGVETVVAEYDLNLVPVVQIMCQPPFAAPGGQVELSVETVGMCNPLQYLWHNGATTPTITMTKPMVDPRSGDDYVTAGVQVTDAAGQTVVVQGNVCGNVAGALRGLKRFEDIDKRQLYRKVNEARDLMLKHGLVNCDPRYCDPPPNTFGRFANWMKRAVLSADNAVPGALKQRTTFINQIVAGTRQASSKSRSKTLRQLVTKAMNDVRSGRYKESYETKAYVPRSDWNEKTFLQMNDLVKEMFRRRR